MLRGGASLGTEQAAIVFTNISTKICTLAGYPTVSLRRHGAPLGKSAQHQGGATFAAITLGAGDQAQALLHDRTSCQAAESDTVRVQPPGIGAFVDKPLQMRGCLLAVEPVTRAD